MYLCVIFIGGCVCVEREGVCKKQIHIYVMVRILNVNQNYYSEICNVDCTVIQPPIKEKDDDACSTKSNSSNASRGKSRPQPPVPAIEEMVEGSITENLTPLQRLARAAQMMNPVQFDLPRDIACTTPLPGKLTYYGDLRC